MRQRLKASTLTLPGLLLLLFLLAVCGCSTSGGDDMETQMSGQWKRSQGDTMKIDLTKDTASLTIDGHVYPVVIDKIDKMGNTIELNVQIEDGKTEKWSIHQMWNDNGSDFNLTLRHNGTTETLTPIGKS